MAKNTKSTAEAVTVELKKDKDCKGSVRFVTDDIKAPISNAYVNRAMNGINDASVIRVTIEIVS